ncbi:hypothetical protein OsI_18178 [Oryza sativa Indica Group]|uniref:DUF6598 domain-containing protein n=2 Tax=Oryza TaxID=4527 RepID=A0A0E0G2X9_ORYNI|nr:hypothetical protein OsI_18178 [Oryza sativa Indica Group]
MAEDDGGGDEWSGLEPFFYDEAAARADGERALERQREKERKEAEHQAWREACDAARDKILEYDPKHGCRTYTRLWFCSSILFNLDEESPIGPLCRTVDRGQPPLHRAGDSRLRMSLNVLAVNIVSSDVGYPVLVYGTVIARDDETLVLTGPTRSIEVSDSVFFEVNLKLKEEEDDGDVVVDDREFSKGLIEFRSLSMPRGVEDVVVGSCSTLDSRLSTVELSYAYIGGAVEAAVDVTLRLPAAAGAGRHRRCFHGQITACSSSIPDASIVLYDSSKVNATSNSSAGGAAGDVAVDLARRVMAVRAADELVLTLIAAAGDADCHHYRTNVEFTPRICGSESLEVSICGIKLLIKVSWSAF